MIIQIFTVLFNAIKAFPKLVEIVDQIFGLWVGLKLDQNDERHEQATVQRDTALDEIKTATSIQEKKDAFKKYMDSRNKLNTK